MAVSWPIFVLTAVFALNLSIAQQTVVVAGKPAKCEAPPPLAKDLRGMLQLFDTTFDASTALWECPYDDLFVRFASPLHKLITERCPTCPDTSCHFIPECPEEPLSGNSTLGGIDRSQWNQSRLVEIQHRLAKHYPAMRDELIVKPYPAIRDELIAFSRPLVRDACNTTSDQLLADRLKRFKTHCDANSMGKYILDSIRIAVDIGMDYVHIAECNYEFQEFKELMKSMFFDFLEAGSLYHACLAASGQQYGHKSVETEHTVAFLHHCWTAIHRAGLQLARANEVCNETFLSKAREYLQQDKELGHQEFADKLYAALKAQYYTKRWLVISYSAGIEGRGAHHASSYPSSSTKQRFVLITNEYGRNLFIAWCDDSDEKTTAVQRPRAANNESAVDWLDSYKNAQSCINKGITWLGTYAWDWPAGNAGEAVDFIKANAPSSMQSVFVITTSSYYTPNVGWAWDEGTCFVYSKDFCYASYWYWATGKTYHAGFHTFIVL